MDLVGTAATGVVELSFTIHAPELLVGFSEAADAMSALIPTIQPMRSEARSAKRRGGLLRMLGRD